MAATAKPPSVGDVHEGLRLLTAQIRAELAGLGAEIVEYGRELDRFVARRKAVLAAKIRRPRLRAPGARRRRRAATSTSASGKDPPDDPSHRPELTRPLGPAGPVRVEADA
jgi:hypothetical protein